MALVTEGKGTSEIVLFIQLYTITLHVFVVPMCSVW